MVVRWLLCGDAACCLLFVGCSLVVCCCVVFGVCWLLLVCVGDLLSLFLLVLFVAGFAVDALRCVLMIWLFVVV